MGEFYLIMLSLQVIGLHISGIIENVLWIFIHSSEQASVASERTHCCTFIDIFVYIYIYIYIIVNKILRKICVITFTENYGESRVACKRCFHFSLASLTLYPFATR